MDRPLSLNEEKGDTFIVLPFFRVMYYEILSFVLMHQWLQFS